jgi:carboxylesterase type B
MYVCHHYFVLYAGVPHVDELLYVFGYPLTNLTLLPNFVSNWTDDDITMTHKMMTWWTDFAKHE